MYTQEDLNKIRQAIADIIAGKKIFYATVGDITLRYSRPKLDELLQLERAVSAVVERRKPLMVITSKGL